MSTEGGDKKVEVLPPMYDFIKEIRQVFVTSSKEPVQVGTGVRPRLHKLRNA